MSFQGLEACKISREEKSMDCPPARTCDLGETAAQCLLDHFERAENGIPSFGLTLPPFGSHGELITKD
jgi:hypothetical protein